MLDQLQTLAGGLNGVERLGIVLSILILYPLLKIGYYLTLHPLARYPGPFLWSISRLPFLYSYWTGWQHRDIKAFHDKYGKIIRVAPDELSFVDPAAWEDIYSNRGGAQAFPKTKVWASPAPGRAGSLVEITENAYHGKMRKRMEGGFTERAVASQEAIVLGYIDLMIKQLRGKVEETGNSETVLDIVKWFVFATVDIIGDLSFGESFQCLEKGEATEWVDFTFSSIKHAVLGASLRFYPWLIWLTEKLTPPSVVKTTIWFWNHIEDKVNRRLARNTDRPDFLTLWQRKDKEGVGLSPEEVYANSFILTLVGSETTATTLSGVMSRIVKEPAKLGLLTKEVREAFDKEDDITFASVKELQYLNAVLWEGFRTCSVLPSGLPRITPPGGGIVCGHRIPGGVYVNLHILSLFLDRERFHEATSFLPERWLPEAVKDPSSPFYNDDRASIQPFSIGPRACIGKNLALAEARTILARMVWAFDIEEADTEAGRRAWEAEKTFSIVEKQPFDIKLKIREQ